MYASRPGVLNWASPFSRMVGAYFFHTELSTYCSRREPSASLKLMFDLLVLTVIGISLFSVALLWMGLRAC